MPKILSKNEKLYKLNGSGFCGKFYLLDALSKLASLGRKFIALYAKILCLRLGFEMFLTE